MDWIQVVNIQTGLDWIHDWIGLGQQKRTHVQLSVQTVTQSAVYR